MQNRYAGDIGDFGKLGLLRTLYAAGLCIKFIPVSQRYYFFIIQPRHRETIQNQIDMIMSSEWKKCFAIVK